MMPTPVSLTCKAVALALAVAVVAACGGDADAPKLPLGHPELGGQGGGAVASIRPETRAALDSGNKLYSAKLYAEALEQYRHASSLEPEEQAPLFGMLMVATARGDSALADSVRTAMKSRAGAGDSLLDVHTRPLPNPHPPGQAKSG